MSMAEAAPPEDCLADCIQVCAQPQRNAADAAAILPVNLRKSRLEVVDHSLCMLTSCRVLERLLSRMKSCQFQRNEIPDSKLRDIKWTADDFSQVVTPECVNRGSSPKFLDSRFKHAAMTDSRRATNYHYSGKLRRNGTDRDSTWKCRPAQE